LIPEAEVKLVSVILCTHNPRREYLQKVLHSLSEQTLPKEDWELLLIDNCSAPPVASQFTLKWHPYSRHVREEELGLSAARIKGVREASGEIIVFVDDDNVLRSDYLQTATEILRSHPEIGALGGQLLPLSDSVAYPAWFYNYAHYFAVGVQSLTSGDVSTRGYLWGAGLVVRRSLLVRAMECGGRPKLTDRRGTSLSSGGDGELCKWVLMQNKRLWYDEKLVAEHLIPPSRLTLDYLSGLINSLGESHRIFGKYDLVVRTPHKQSLGGYLVSTLKLIYRSLRYGRVSRAQFELVNPLPYVVIDQELREIKLFAEKLRTTGRESLT
jgi:glycosyltransferase involved in cell wall biosynthesis